MHSIEIPQTVDAYIADIHERALPDDRLAQHEFYKGLVGWVLDNRTPLLYEQDHTDEYANFSINFNWLLLRDYAATKLGPPITIATMYGLHEMTHMTHRLPTRLDICSASEYAQDFTESEYRASNETEILIHYRVPELRSLVLNGTKIAYDLLHERGVEQPTSRLLGALRPLVIEHDVMDDYFSATAEDQAILARMKRFDGNQRWARERFAVIRPYFSGDDVPVSSGLTDDEFEETIARYTPQLDQATYEANVIRNVRFGYRMCGLIVPKLVTFNEAREAAFALEGQHAIVQS